MARSKLARPSFKLIKRYAAYSIEFWWEGRAHRVSTGTGDEHEARKALAAFEAGWGKPQAPDVPTIAEILNGYQADRAQNLERPLAAPESLGFATVALKRHLGDLIPDLLTRDICRQYTRQRREEGFEVGPAGARRRKPVQDGTIIRELGLLRTALRWAKNEKWIADVPYVEVPASVAPRDRWLSRDEAARLIEACGDFHIRVFVTLGLHTGARSGAILGLTWTRVDLENGRIDYGAGAGRKGRARGVPISPELTATLLAARELAQSDYVVEFAGAPVKSIKTGFRAACRRAGLENVTPHTLRHTAATWMAQARVPMWEIAGILGHSDVTMIQKVYGHYSPDALVAATSAIGRIAQPVGEAKIRVRRMR
ncbi:site-specific integrase [Roseicella sp. DB1501]|uniref:site-specific integrase n=1 Tax=Roseicella sp. DB1501 TaxID=2730925 RepID=UPI001490D4A6|nr:site-specific integrase [Roseicella sp. DB1501]NOG70437.1 site-specific integrase [Roseicella sp. DB1501]